MPAANTGSSGIDAVASAADVASARGEQARSFERANGVQRTETRAGATTVPARILVKGFMAIEFIGWKWGKESECRSRTSVERVDSIPRCPPRANPRQPSREKGAPRGAAQGAVI